MGRKSSIEFLPENIIKGINEKLAEGHSLDTIMKWITQLGFGDKTSRSAVGRWKMNREELSGELKRSRVIAEAIVRDTGDSDQGQISRVATEMLHSIIMKATAASLSGSTPDYDPQEMAYIARALKDSNAAIEIDDKRVARIKADAMKEAAKAVDAVASKGGLSKESVAQIKKEFLGV